MTTSNLLILSLSLADTVTGIIPFFSAMEEVMERSVCMSVLLYGCLSEHLSVCLRLYLLLTSLCFIIAQDTSIIQLNDCIQTVRSTRIPTDDTVS